MKPIKPIKENVGQPVHHLPVHTGWFFTSVRCQAGNGKLYQSSYNFAFAICNSNTPDQDQICLERRLYWVGNFSSVSYYV